MNILVLLGMVFGQGILGSVVWGLPTDTPEGRAIQYLNHEGRSPKKGKKFNELLKDIKSIDSLAGIVKVEKEFSKLFKGKSQLEITKITQNAIRSRRIELSKKQLNTGTYVSRRPKTSAGPRSQRAGSGTTTLDDGKEESQGDSKGESTIESQGDSKGVSTIEPQPLSLSEPSHAADEEPPGPNTSDVAQAYQADALAAGAEEKESLDENGGSDEKRARVESKRKPVKVNFKDLPRGVLGQISSFLDPAGFNSLVCSNKQAQEVSQGRLLKKSMVVQKLSEILEVPLPNKDGKFTLISNSNPDSGDEKKHAGTSSAGRISSTQAIRYATALQLMLEHWDPDFQELEQQLVAKVLSADSLEAKVLVLGYLRNVNRPQPQEIEAKVIAEIGNARGRIGSSVPMRLDPELCKVRINFESSLPFLKEAYKHFHETQGQGEYAKYVLDNLSDSIKRMAIEDDSPTMISILQFWERRYKDPNIMLLTAAEFGKPRLARFLCKRGASPNHRFSVGTPLQVATVGGEEEVLKVLLDQNPDLEARDYQGNSLLHLAARAKNHRTNIVSLILSKKPELLESKNGALETPLHVAARSGRADAIELLIKQGADSKMDGNTVVHMVASGKSDNSLALQYFLKNTQEPRDALSAKNSAGQTPLHLALRTGSDENVSILLKKGANLEATDNEGNTAFHVAVQTGRVAWIKSFAKRARHDVRNNRGQTPLAIAQDALKVLKEEYETLSASWKKAPWRGRRYESHEKANLESKLKEVQQSIIKNGEIQLYMSGKSDEEVLDFMRRPILIPKPTRRNSF